MRLMTSLIVSARAAPRISWPTVTHQMFLSNIAFTSAFWQTSLASVVLPNPPAPQRPVVMATLRDLELSSSRTIFPDSSGRATTPLAEGTAGAPRSLTRPDEACQTASAIQMPDSTASSAKIVQLHPDVSTLTTIATAMLITVTAAAADVCFVTVAPRSLR